MWAFQDLFQEVSIDFEVLILISISLGGIHVSNVLGDYKFNVGKPKLSLRKFLVAG